MCEDKMKARINLLRPAVAAAPVLGPSGVGAHSASEAWSGMLYGFSFGGASRSASVISRGCTRRIVRRFQPAVRVT